MRLAILVTWTVLLGFWPPRSRSRCTAIGAMPPKDTSTHDRRRSDRCRRRGLMGLLFYSSHHGYDDRYLQG